MGTISADTRVKVTLVTLSESSGDYTTTTTTAMIMSAKQQHVHQTYLVCPSALIET